MESYLISQGFDRVPADAIAVVIFAEEAAPAELASAAAWLEELRASGEFTGKPGELAVLHQAPAVAAKRLVVVGGGKRDDFDATALRRAVGSTVRSLKQKGVKYLAWCLSGGDAAAAVEGAILGNFEPDIHKTSSKESKSLDVFSVVVRKDSGRLAELHPRVGE
jgi:leucyl aminopeptidase